ncbi:hypothetical protein NC651_034909 [Populus alba x Populus x berolinensis]|nr:hypothetical protein NC651_034909 [Populus alba x Populus x berolinensis]
MGDCDVHMQNSSRPWKAFSWFLDSGPHPSGYKDICGPFSCPVVHLDFLGAQKLKGTYGTDLTLKIICTRKSMDIQR